MLIAAASLDLKISSAGGATFKEPGRCGEEAPAQARSRSGQVAPVSFVLDCHACEGAPNRSPLEERGEKVVT